MKLRSSKAALSCGMVLVMCLMPFVPVVADAATTYEQQQSTTNQNISLEATYTENVSDIVATGDQTNKETGMFSGKAIAITDPYIEVRATANEGAEVNGRLYANSIADAVEVTPEWTKINSGNLIGYVKTSTLCFNEEAEAIARVNGDITATVNTEAANVISLDNTGNVIYTAGNEETFSAVAKCGDYTAIVLQDGTKGYIDSNYVTVNYGMSNGMTNEEAVAYEEAKEAERIAKEQAEAEEAARKAEEEAKAAEEARRKTIIANTKARNDVTYNSSMSASDEDIWLLSCIIDWEAGWESYEGKLAVANVVLNRVRSSRYANSISGVIYSRGQFSGVLDSAGNVSSQFSSRLSSGARSNECMQAALEALSGTNNVGSYTSFIAISSANLSAYSNYMIIGNHVFH